MPEVHVTFPAKGNTLIDNDPEAVVSGRRIRWHFSSMHPTAAIAGIVFNKPETKIFETQGSWCGCYAVELKNGRGIIWAEPAKQGKNQTRSKYTIFAWDKNGQMVVELALDPHIIIDDP